MMDEARKKRIVIVISLIILAVIVGIAVYLNSDNKAEISFDQMNHFAGNMLELRSKDGDPCLIMSKAAYESLSKKQIAFLESKMKLITPDLECIETNGGGSARCMIAEIFSPKK